VRENEDYIHHWYLGLEEINDNLDQKAVRDFLDEHLKNTNKNYKVARDKALKGVKVSLISSEKFVEWNDANKKKGGQVKMAKVMKEDAFREFQEFVEG
jgi:hypothetical protein